MYFPSIIANVTCSLQVCHLQVDLIALMMWGLSANQNVRYSTFYGLYNALSILSACSLLHSLRRCYRKSPQLLQGQ